MTRIEDETLQSALLCRRFFLNTLDASSEISEANNVSSLFDAQGQYQMSIMARGLV